MDRTGVLASDLREWLEADGLGGFASGTVCGVRTRRYHALLLVATRPPSGRFVLVNACEAWVETPTGRHALSTHRYAPDVRWPDGAERLVAFFPDPWPRWEYELPGRIRIGHEILAAHGAPCVALSWRLLAPAPGVRLEVRPLLSGRDYHALHQENGAFDFTPRISPPGRVSFRPYPALPPVSIDTNGTYHHTPDWYRRFAYAEEEARGLDAREDLAAPGVFHFDLSTAPAVCLLEAGPGPANAPPAPARLEALRDGEARRRNGFGSRLHRAADAYLVRRGEGVTIVAGYPWFTDWGRDTFIALRGLCLAGGRIDDARRILLEWSRFVSQGMLPNRFPDAGETPEYNSVDASLWFVVAVGELFDRAELTGAERRALSEAVLEVLAGHERGTRFGIRVDQDGLLWAGEPGVQLTWMDARVGEHVVTPRVGKPVEVQALWLNALHAATRFGEPWRERFRRGRRTFRARFWRPAEGCLWDVIDPEDGAFRPNQIFAVGGLPIGLLPLRQARRVVDAVQARLWTPLGLRSLAPEEAAYVGRYEGGVHQRDGAYHQGTVWPWLLGPFVEGWLRVRGGSARARSEARRRFLEPILAHLDEAGIGSVSEIADGDPPHTPRGCPFQAWSVGELLRLVEGVLARPKEETTRVAEAH